MIDQEEIMNEYKKNEKDFIKEKRLIILQKIFKIFFITLLVSLLYFLLINTTFIYDFFTTNFAEYFDYFDFCYIFLSLEGLLDDYINIDYLIPIINISIPKAISLAILLIVYILSIKNIIKKNKNYSYMDYTMKIANNELDNKKPTKNPILLSLKFIFSILWAMFKIIFFYILSLLILCLIVSIFAGIVSYFDWFIDFAGGTAGGIILGILVPIFALSAIVSFFSGGNGGNSGKQKSSTVVYDKDGNIDWVMTDVQQRLENEQNNK